MSEDLVQTDVEVTRCGHQETLQWWPIMKSHRDDGAEIVVRIKNHHARMPAKLLGRSVHQIGRWSEGDLWVAGVKVHDDVVEGFMPLPEPKST